MWMLTCLSSITRAAYLLESKNSETRALCRQMMPRRHRIAASKDEPRSPQFLTTSLTIPTRSNESGQKDVGSTC